MLGERGLYDLSRLDLVARSTLNGAAQQEVTRFLLGLANPEQAATAGLYGKYLFASGQDLSKIVYSFTLYEKSPQGMLLRVQADNLNQPFDINQQTRLDLGSTAKFRTLISYLEVVARLHGQYAGLSTSKLGELAQPRRDVLAQWVAAHLASAQDKSLKATLEAAMARRYSAAPQVFYTGGGEHVFANFNKDDNSRVMDVWEATRNSVNLVYIRIMRDIVQHYLEASPGAASRVIDDAGNPQRQLYLLKFVDQEARVCMRRFYQRHEKSSATDMAADLYQRARQNPRRFTALFRYLEPRADWSAYLAALRQSLPATASMQESVLRKLYEQNAPEAYSLADRGYVTQIHPLEIWLVGYLRANPGVDFEEAFSASAKERVQVYDWLLAANKKNAQDIRIQSLIEVEAFEALHKDWKRLGYPFNNLTPSYATSIGSSGDRPAALAELMGIIVNDGVRLPVTSLHSLDFAVGTPYETRLRLRNPQPERLLPKEVAQVARKALGLVVETGTAVRLHGAIKDAAGNAVPIGGKTGTGDHRYVRYGAGGQLLEARAVNRTATFVFYLGDRYFGTFTALVPGRDAENYQFTSSLTAQILKTLLPRLQTSLLPETLKVTVATPPASQTEAVPTPTEEDLPEQPTQMSVDIPLQRGPAKRATEAREGTAHEVQPRDENAAPGGFPDDLEPVLLPAAGSKPSDTVK